jgi:hypothetical protein
MAGQYYTHPLTIKLKISPAIASSLPRYRRRTTTGSQPHAEMENYRRLVKLHTLINERRTPVTAQEIQEIDVSSAGQSRVFGLASIDVGT